MINLLENSGEEFEGAEVPELDGWQELSNQVKATINHLNRNIAKLQNIRENETSGLIRL